MYKDPEAGRGLACWRDTEALAGYGMPTGEGHVQHGNTGGDGGTQTDHVRPNKKESDLILLARGSH